MSNQSGFTLVELLIASTVFSLILLLSAFALLQVGRQYYKGITASQTQDTARNVMDTISQNIQFGGGQIVVTQPGQQFFCIGSQRYSFILGKELSDNPDPTQTTHALVEDTPSSCTSTQDLTKITEGSKELLNQHMRLAKLSVTKVPNTENLYSINVKVVSGDDDVLNNPNGDATCIGGAGSQFCATSELTSIVEKRI